MNLSSRRHSRHYHANQLKTVRHSVLADTKKVLVNIVQDDSVSIEEFRLMATLAGATLDCFFRLDDDKCTATPFETKQDIVKQLLYTDRKIRHIKANAKSRRHEEHATSKSKNHRSGGNPSFTEVLWDRRVQFLRILVDRAFPIVMTTMGVPPPAQGIVRKILDNMIESVGKTKSNREIMEGKQKQIEALLKQIDRNSAIRSIHLDKVQNRMTMTNTFLEYSKDNLGTTTEVHQQNQHWSEIGKDAFADHVQSYTHNVIHDISKAEQQKNIVATSKPLKSAGTNKSVSTTASTHPLSKQDEYYALKLAKMKSSTVKEKKKVVSIEKKKKDLDNVIKFLKVVVAENQAQQHHGKQDVASQEKRLKYKVDLIENNVKNPLLYSSTKWVQENPIRSAAVVGALSCVAFAQLLSMVEDEPDEFRDEREANSTHPIQHENLIKQRAQHIMHNVKTRHLITSVPVLLSLLFIVVKRHTLGTLSDMLAGTIEPQKDKIVRYIATDMVSYDDTQQCLRKVDHVLHDTLRSHKTIGEVYYALCKEQFNRRNRKLTRAVLNGHLMRKNGELRASIAEIAFAVKKVYRHTNVVGRLNTKRKAVFATRRTPSRNRRRSDTNIKTKRKNNKPRSFFHTTRRSVSA